MQSSIRKMTEDDRAAVLAMMRVFYASPAVLSNGSEAVFNGTLDHCLRSGQYAEGYVFHDRDAVQGYAIVAKSFSTESGKPCIWIEDLYIKPAYRGSGLGGRFLDFVEALYPEAVLRLEAESGNAAAIHVYEKHGYEVLPYTQMIRLR